MVFSSPLFLFLYLPLFLVGYHLVFLPAQLAHEPRRRRIFTSLANAFILVASLLFYFWGETWLTLVMLSSTTIDYGAGLLLGRTKRTGWRRLLLSVSILANLSILAFFKYAHFGLENFQRVAGALGVDSASSEATLSIALPLGISFYTFQSMSYTIDIYRGQVQPTRNYFDFACYVTMFPQLVAGPIVRYRSVASQLARRSLSLDLFSSGCIRFITGLGKKVLLSNLVAVPADQVFDVPQDQLTMSLAWLGVVSYTLQIYFDFSGYSDMAIGLGRMLGFRFPENFNYPYAATSIQDFWRRWHISLSSWFRDYLYIPLGGGRVGSARVYLNLAVVFLLCGLWHGASWSFVLWGLYHGLFLIAERLGLSRGLLKLWRPLRHLYVLLTVMGGWVLFRAADLSQAGGIYQALLGLSDPPKLYPWHPSPLTNEVAVGLVVGALLSWPLLFWLRRFRDRGLQWLAAAGRLPGPFLFGSVKVAVLMAVLIYSCAHLASGAYNPFIYFRF